MIGEHDDGPTTTPADDLRQQLSPRAAREASEAIRDATNDPTASASAPPTLSKVSPRTVLSAPQVANRALPPVPTSREVCLTAAVPA